MLEKNNSDILKEDDISEVGSRIQIQRGTVEELMLHHLSRRPRNADQIQLEVSENVMNTIFPEGGNEQELRQYLRIRSKEYLQLQIFLRMLHEQPNARGRYIRGKLAPIEKDIVYGIDAFINIDRRWIPVDFTTDPHKIKTSGVVSILMPSDYMYRCIKTLGLFSHHKKFVELQELQGMIKNHMQLYGKPESIEITCLGSHMSLNSFIGPRKNRQSRNNKDLRSLQEKLIFADLEESLPQNLEMYRHGGLSENVERILRKPDHDIEN